MRHVDIEIEGVTLHVECDVYNDRCVRPDSWWAEAKITVNEHEDLTALLQKFSQTKPWDTYDDLMEQVEAQLIEEVAV